MHVYRYAKDNKKSYKLKLRIEYFRIYPNTTLSSPKRSLDI